MCAQPAIETTSRLNATAHSSPAQRRTPGNRHPQPPYAAGVTQIGDAARASCHTCSGFSRRAYSRHGHRSQEPTPRICRLGLRTHLRRRPARAGSTSRPAALWGGQPMPFHFGRHASEAGCPRCSPDAPGYSRDEGSPRCFPKACQFSWTGTAKLTYNRVARQILEI